MTGTATRPPTTLGNAPSMPATQITTRAFINAALWLQQAVDAGDAYVEDVFDLIAHESSGKHGFFGNGNIAGAGGDHRDDAFARRSFVAFDGDSAGERMELHFAAIFSRYAFHCREHFLVGAGD